MKLHASILGAGPAISMTRQGILELRGRLRIRRGVGHDSLAERLENEQLKTHLRVYVRGPWSNTLYARGHLVSVPVAIGRVLGMP